MRVPDAIRTWLGRDREDALDLAFDRYLDTGHPDNADDGDDLRSLDSTVRQMIALDRQAFHQALDRYPIDRDAIRRKVMLAIPPTRPVTRTSPAKPPSRLLAFPNLFGRMTGSPVVNIVLIVAILGSLTYGLVTTIDRSPGEGRNGSHQAAIVSATPAATLADTPAPFSDISHLKEVLESLGMEVEFDTNLLHTDAIPEAPGQTLTVNGNTLVAFFLPDDNATPRAGARSIDVSSLVLSDDDGQPVSTESEKVVLQVDGLILVLLDWSAADIELARFAIGTATSSTSTSDIIPSTSSYNVPQIETAFRRAGHFVQPWYMPVVSDQLENVRGMEMMVDGKLVFAFAYAASSPLLASDAFVAIDPSTISFHGEDGTPKAEGAHKDVVLLANAILIFIDWPREDVEAAKSALVSNTQVANVSFRMPVAEDCKIEPLSVDQVLTKLDQPEENLVEVFPLNEDQRVMGRDANGDPITVANTFSPQVADSTITAEVVEAQRQYLACSIFGSGGQMFALQSNVYLQESMVNRSLPFLDSGMVRADIAEIASAESPFSNGNMTWSPDLDDVWFPMVPENAVAMQTDSYELDKVRIPIIWMKADGTILNYPDENPTEWEDSRQLEQTLPNWWVFVKNADTGVWKLDSTEQVIVYTSGY